MPGTAPTPVNYSNVVDEVVTQQFLRGEWNNTLKIRYLWKALNDNGCIVYDASGKYHEWKVRLGDWSGSANYRGDLVQRNFARKQHRATYTGAYSFLEIPGMFSERDLQFLNTPENMSNFQTGFLTEMGEDFGKALNTKLLSENTTANTVMGVAATSTSDVPLYGLLTMFSHSSGTAQNYVVASNTTTGNVGATDVEVLPNSTFCGISTNPVTGVTGVDNQVVGSAAPVLINHTSTTWTGTNTWLSTATKVLDYAQVRLTRGQGPENKPDLVIQTRARFLDTKAAMRAASSQMVVFMDTGGRSPNMGTYEDGMIPFNGMAITYDENQPTDVNYFLNTKQMKFKVFPQKSLAGTENGKIQGSVKEPFRVAQGWDIDAGAWKVVAVLCAQMLPNPYFQGASYAFA